MPVSKNHTQELLDDVEDEGKAVLHVAPSKATVRGIPPAWAKVLASGDARTDVLKLVWGPLSSRLPKTIKAMQRSLQGVGVLTTKSCPASLIYFFTLEDKEPHFYRGYPPATKLPAKAKKLPKEFLEFYEVHDGWEDQFQCMGPRRSENIEPLGTGKASSKFLVVMDGNGGAMLGYDMTESPPLCYSLPSDDDPPKLVPKVWKELDGWIATQMEDLLPYKAK